jgi:hypothetical protein
MTNTITTRNGTQNEEKEAVIALSDELAYAPAHESATRIRPRHLSPVDMTSQSARRSERRDAAELR